MGEDIADKLQNWPCARSALLPVLHVFAYFQIIYIFETELELTMWPMLALNY